MSDTTTGSPDTSAGLPTSVTAPPAAADGPSVYAAQARGDDDAYASYYAGMDKSMQQKVALTTAFFPPTGTLVDMGCGSGSGSFDLASLFAGLRVIGVDIAPPAVEHATAHYRRPNLRCFPPRASTESSTLRCGIT